MGGVGAAAETLMGLYERALPLVYGYLLDRCGDVATAEDLTSETFLAAARAAAADGGTQPVEVSIPWIFGVARHKLVDHWRRRGRDERLQDELARLQADVDDPWDRHVDALTAARVLRGLGGHHRSALTLRYLDGLSVPEVAEVLGRTVHATEALLVRARVAFRTGYEQGEGHG